MARGESDWEGVRLHVVTGKGGTGKTTVAAALAIALARAGQTVLLCEVEGRQGLARLFDKPSLPYAETRLCSFAEDAQPTSTPVAAQPAASGAHAVEQEQQPGTVYGLAIDPQAALLEYLELYYHLGRAGKMLDKIGAIDFATTIAPGVRDVLLTGKVYEAVRRWEKARREGRRVRGRIYDTVVLDAPPTGRIGRFLNVNAGVADLARVGPIRQQADSITRMLRSPQTAVHVVSTLEEMPVQETADGIEELTRIGIPVGGVVVNFVRPTLFDPPALRDAAADRLGNGGLAEKLARQLAEVGLPDRPGIVDGLLVEGREHALSVRSQAEQRTRLEELERPSYELPYLVDGINEIDLGSLAELAAALTEQGMA